MTNENVIEVKTRLGTMVARQCSDPDNRGIYIEFIPKGKTVAIDTVVVEVPETEDCVSIYTYDNPQTEEWQHKFAIGNDDIQQALKDED